MFLSMNTILYWQWWPETAAYNRDQLGLPVSFESDWLVEFQVSESGCLSVAEERPSRIKSVTGVGLAVTLRVEDADAAHARLGVAGLKVGPVRKHAWNARLFRFHDPEGHRLEV